MAAYAALLSLRHIIEQLQHHPFPPICLDQNQVQSVTDNLNFLQIFLEQGYPCVGISKEAIDVFESRIADAAHAAEDIIETRVVDQILTESTAQASKDITETWVCDQILGGSKKTKNTRMRDHLLRILSTFCGAGSSRSPSTRQNVNIVAAGLDVVEKISSVDLYRDLDKVIQDMGLIKKDVMEIKDNNIGIIEDHLHINSSTLAGAASSRSPLTTKQETMVGFDELLIEVMDKLTGQQSNLRIIPIVGMGGIGKTTLVRNAYAKPLIVHHLNYNVQDILIEILLCVSKYESREILSGKSEGELSERVHKSLWGRRYLIVMDDIWSIEVWDRAQIFFPDNGQGSRVMITTRLSNVVFQLIGSHGLVMDFLNEYKSWELLRKSIFEKQEDCPLELEEIGKKIAKNCKGLHLSIVVIGGLLAKSKPTREYWEYISENLNSIVHLEENERCLKVLHLSYNHLPVHLKPCFLYMGVFPEDKNIPVSWLVKFCKIHDLVRELCLREAEKEKFIYVRRPHALNIPQGIINTRRRISIHQSASEKEYLPQARHALECMPLARSLIVGRQGVLPSLNCFRLLRVLNAVDKYLNDRVFSLEAVFQLVNSRFIAITSDRDQNADFPSSINLLWNLQTLIVKERDAFAPSEIWKMTQLRHVQFNQLEMPDPPLDGKDEYVLGNLRTLSRIRNFKCGEEVVKRIPNINKLQICYHEQFDGCSSYCLDNLVRLHKLESFGCFFFTWNRPNRDDVLRNFILPNSLKKLTLHRTNLYWEDMKTKIGLLPNLQVLKLKANSFVGTEWETVEGQFCNLKFLQICDCSDLERWTTESAHFPRLEQLDLRHLDRLEEIPSDIGEIPTLQSIRVQYCSKTAVISAKRILDEQEEFDNVGLRVRVVARNIKHFESLASPNFQVEVIWMN
ncbi:hypothetical protein ACP275_05G078000 [Erythranthe tilingii]